MTNVTDENAQARERTQVLLDLSNELGGFVLGTGALAALALGWATSNADHMSRYGVNAGVPKTLVRPQVSHPAASLGGEAAAILREILDSPVSPELLPPGGDGETAPILYWLRTFDRRFFAQQFKRCCLPDGPKVGYVSVSPRGDWRMPSDASAALWLEEIDSLTA